MDTFRKKYKELNVCNSIVITEMKEAAEKLELYMRTISNREMSLALTNLEQAVMWATKAIVLHDERTNGEPIHIQVA